MSDSTTVAGPEIVLAEPRGFCAGVDRAIDIVERALELYGAPIYVRHEIVHNRYVVDDLRKKGAIFIDELDEAPADAIVVFSAHGVSRKVRDDAESMGLKVFDATCPLVTKVHREVARMREAGREIIMIGHRGHPEVEGTLGQADAGMYLVETVDDVEALEVKNPDMLAFVTQTTLSVDDAEVVGSPNSSNSNRLREVAERRGAAAYLIDNPDMINPEWLNGSQRVGVTAGASAPEVLVKQVISRLKQLGAVSVRTLDGTPENVSFPLPRELSRKRVATEQE